MAVKKVDNSSHGTTGNSTHQGVAWEFAACGSRPFLLVDFWLLKGVWYNGVYTCLTPVASHELTACRSFWQGDKYAWASYLRVPTAESLHQPETWILLRNLSFPHGQTISFGPSTPCVEYLDPQVVLQSYSHTAPRSWYHFVNLTCEDGPIDLKIQG